MRAVAAGAALLIVSQAFAGEFAVLSNGFTIRIDRHEEVGTAFRLYNGTGFVEVPASTVTRFEQEYQSPPVAPPAAQPQAAADPRQLVEEAARRYGLPPQFLHSVALAESGFQPEAVSPKGALGIMQLMPATAQRLGVDPSDPRQNVEGGARYLSELLLKYKNDPYQVRKALAAYNAGPGAVDRYQGVPPYRETVEYVERVIRQAGLRK